MYWRVFLVCLSLFFAACAVKQENKVAANNSLVLTEETFNTKLLRALAYESVRDFSSASAVFLELYKEYKEPSLLERAFVLAILNNSDKKILDSMNEMAKKYDTANIIKVRISYYVKFADIKNALILLERLIKKDKDFRNYELAGDLYLFSKNLNKALSYYKSANSLLPDQFKPSEALSIKISELEFLLNNKEASKKILKDFIKANNNKCSLLVCARLAMIYANEKNLEGFKDISLELYELSQNPEFLLNVISAYYNFGKKQELYDNISSYLENNSLPIYFILEVMKDSQTANNFANRLYNKTKNTTFLSISAIIEYEDMRKTNTVNEKKLKSIIEKFDKSVNKNSEAHVLNFYGYLLIDHNVNVSKGIELVNLALKAEPKNVYYLDSLAWGYYKQGKCEKALDLMQEALKYDSKNDMINSSEYKEHIKAINSCLGVKD